MKIGRMRYSIFPRLLVWLLIALGTAEALHGFGQLMGLWPSGHSLYRLTGSFYNPGPYMGYLALSLPLCLHEWMRPAQGFARWRQRAAMTAAALILCLLPAGMSRAAWAAATAAAGYVLWMHHRKRILRGMRRHRQRAVVCLAAGVLVLAAAAAGAYLMKKDSADGRRLMWKVAAQAVCRRPWTGCRMLYRAGAYGQAAACFAAHHADRRHDARFLFEYGHALHRMDRPEESNRVLREAMEVSGDPMILNVMAKNCRRMGRHDEAERWLLRSVHRLPGRIYPYYLLARLYGETGAFPRRKLEWAVRRVTETEPKVHSTAVREMREQVRRMMEGLE